MYKYEKIALSIQATIANGDLITGQKLPKLREMAKINSCSIETVLKSYQLLLKHGIVYQIPHSGYYVANKLTVLGEEFPRDDYLLDSGNSDSELFNKLNLAPHLESAGKSYRKITRNIPMKGNESLINYLPKYLENQGVYTKAEMIYLCLGALHALTILSKMTFPNKKQFILIEEPTYSYFIDYLKEQKLDVLTIKRDYDQLDLNELEELFRSQEIKFFYIVARNHNPLGSCLRYCQRKRIVELAEKYDVYLVEDDYLSGYDGLKKYAPLFYMDQSDHTVYLQSFSKVLPMLRIGLIVLPQKLQVSFENAMKMNYFTTYYTPSLLAQSVLENYLRSHDYERHRLLFTTMINKKISRIAQIVKTWQQVGFCYQVPVSGLYSTIQLENNHSVTRLFQNLKKRGVYVKKNHISFLINWKMITVFG